MWVKSSILDELNFSKLTRATNSTWQLLVAGDAVAFASVLIRYITLTRTTLALLLAGGCQQITVMLLLLLVLEVVLVMMLLVF